jgi:2-oxoglutarate ferredoxin oxidoreductase subunit alpha
MAYLPLPGQALRDIRVVTDSDEHDEDGHLIEDAATRVQMVDKRLFRKMPLIRSEITPLFFMATAGLTLSSPGGVQHTGS